MGEFAEIKEMLNSHVKDSNSFREEMRTSITEIQIHSKYTKKAVAALDEDVTNLKTSHNKQKGAMWVVGVLGLSGIIKFVIDIFKKTAE